MRQRPTQGAAPASSELVAAGSVEKVCSRASMASLFSSVEGDSDSGMRELRRKFAALQEENDRMRETIEDLEAENENLKRERRSQGQADEAKLRHREEALSSATKSFQDKEREVQKLQALFREAEAKASEAQRELRQRLEEKEKEKKEQAAELEASLNKVKHLEEQVAQARRSPTRARLGSKSNLFHDDFAHHDRKLVDLKGLVEAPVFTSLEAIDDSWREFKRLL